MHKTARLLLATLVGATATVAQAIQPKGYITNETGQQCWYRQAVDPAPSYFHSLPGPHITLTFDDPKCMRDTGQGLGLDIAKMLINNNIVRNHSRPDANFATLPDQMYPSSLLQVRGQCIQSQKYPTRGVAVEYIIAGQAIKAVKHASTVAGCTR